MLNAEYSPLPGGLRLRLSGHAGTAPAGRDLVCAAASGAAGALAALLAEAPPAWFCAPPRVRLAPGDTELAARPVPAAAPRVAGWFELAAAALQLLAQNYPGAVRFFAAPLAPQPPHPHPPQPPICPPL